jgi:hypothetical protein
VTLALVLWPMTDYQDAGLTGLHTVAFFCNSLLVWKMRRGFNANAAAERQSGIIIEPNTIRERRLPEMARHQNSTLRWIYQGFLGLCIGLILAQAALGIATAMLQSRQFQQLFSAIPATSHANLTSRILDLMVPRIYLDPNDVIFAINIAVTRAILQLDERDSINRIEGPAEAIAEFKQLLCTKPKYQLARNILQNRMVWNAIANCYPAG